MKNLAPLYRVSLVLGLGLALTFLAACEDTRVESLRLSDVGPFSARLEVSLSEAGIVSVRYGEGHLYDRRSESNTPNQTHVLELTGLKPSTLYRYRMEPEGKVASFRSAPRSDGAFDLVLLSPEHTACMAGAAEPPLWPDLVLLTGSCDGPLAKHPAERLIRTLPSGPETMSFGSVELHLNADLDTVREASSGDDTQAAKRRVFVLAKEPPEIPQSRDVVLTPTAAFVHGQRIDWPKGLAAWLEVDAFEISWINAEQDKGERKVLVEAPPEARKTCLYCDRLLESGRYEESIAWYERFARDNPQNRGAQEDSAFNIVRILDEKLFRYAEAQERYKTFLAEYPQSRRAMLVRYRLDYLDKYKDGHFEPLMRFEKAKAQRTADDPLPSIHQVEATVSEYPGASIGQEALFWLGHLLEDLDAKRAEDHYKTLMKRFPKSENAALAAISLGDMAYKEKRYNEAIADYEAAAKIAGASYQVSIADKLRKSERNIKREWARWGSWLLFLGWIAFTLWKRPAFRVQTLKSMALLASSYALLFGIYFLIDYEKALPVVGIVGLGALLCVLVFFWNRWLFGEKPSRWAWIHGLSASLGLWYLALYQMHYLYVLGI